MKAAVSEGGVASSEALAEMVKAWGPMNEAGINMWRQMLDQMSGRSQS